MCTSADLFDVGALKTGHLRKPRLQSAVDIMSTV